MSPDEIRAKIEQLEKELVEDECRESGMNTARPGRPQASIDWQMVDALCIAQCTLAEIAVHFGVSEDTIERAVKREHSMSFADYFGQKRKAGFVSLRRKQWELAMSGNCTMLIFLGKQWLGQSDKQEVNVPQIRVICDM